MVTLFEKALPNSTSVMGEADLCASGLEQPWSDSDSLREEAVQG